MAKAAKKVEMNAEDKVLEIIIQTQRHVASLAEKVQENLKAAGFKSTVEGEEKADWVLIDAFDVIVHIFKPEVREFYSIEKMWQSVKSRS